MAISELMGGVGRDPLVDQVTSRAQFLTCTFWVPGVGVKRESLEVEGSSEH